MSPLPPMTTIFMAAFSLRPLPPSRVRPRDAPYDIADGRPSRADLLAIRLDEPVEDIVVLSQDLGHARQLLLLVFGPRLGIELDRPRELFEGGVTFSHRLVHAVGDLERHGLLQLGGFDLTAPRPRPQG